MVPMEMDQGIRPIQRLCNAGLFEEISSSDLLHEGTDLLCEGAVDGRNLRQKNTIFFFERGIVDPVIETPSFQGVVDFPGSIRRDDNQRPLCRAQGSDFRNGNLKVRKDLQEKSLKLLV